MESQKMIRHNLMIGGRSYPVMIDKSEAEDLKQIEADVNDKINEYMVKYPDNDRIDIVSMALLSIVFELNKKRFDTIEEKLKKRLNNLSDILDASL